MRICMASDFFFPSFGGVEEHIYNLSQCLITKGHKVIVVTHSYGGRKGIRYMTNGLKVYYLPIKTFYNQCILPTMICNIPLYRDIFVRERIDIVHGHSAFSALAHEMMLVASLLNLRVIFTDHSLFGFADLSAVVTNKFLQISLCTCNHCICVSHIGKENTVLRASVPAHKVSVIPNAVDTALFTPNPIKRPQDGSITVVVVSRLVYRKGIDLLVGIISKISQMPQLRHVNFLIGGDGPKRGLLEEIREKNNMQDRVTLLGALEHSKVRDVLTRGHIFLNTSLTEAYCMAIVEAAATGLQVVSTKVGGIPEVLPDKLIIMTDPTVEGLLRGLVLAINKHRERQKLQHISCNGVHRNDAKNYDAKNDVLCPFSCNSLVAELYNWENVAMRTEKVYQKVLREPNQPLGNKLASYLITGVWPYLLVVSLCYLILRLCEWFTPKSHIDIARDFPSCQRPPQRIKSKKRRR
ncbi:phosphatidylinositol N-acetylglucosaminyltransferase subunit A isoform X1 [Lutzomyia longipalpis]|uniref:phosphatidylinositol N-acetylglucosaminyltransferase subunit A isoform X1 n=1 Tax=Lutzomyia longipalpis TaxID=7200 RepID=UPI002483862A|nr:phosphatidylinositol N-acetylglucosaminyltransferase subunit A isoform X1 [Lutzomyia longipalpis]